MSELAGKLAYITKWNTTPEARAQEVERLDWLDRNEWRLVLVPYGTVGPLLCAMRIGNLSLLETMFKDVVVLGWPDEGESWANWFYNK